MTVYDQMMQQDGDRLYSELSLRLARLELAERSLAARRDRSRRDMAAIAISVLAGIVVTIALVLAQEKGWISPADIGPSSWVQTLAPLGALACAVVLVGLGVAARRDETTRARRHRLHNEAHDEGSTAAAE